ncbi:YeeE/YedE family protein [Stenotrophomonas sp. LGBM10]|uniref:YeeE/YedE family protein n=1 Tax=Stenotrophomonas sp. LGBM10 TaxID=3390038 RepID=UPI00398B8784
MLDGWPAALLGGVLIGAAATLLLWLNGRIAGISGMVDGAVAGERGDRVWRWAFLIGLVAAGAAWLAWVPGAAVPRSDFPRPLLVIAGLLVGYGARLGGGCTSGHGVCGLARRSRRSLVAVPVFLLTAMLTTFVVRHLGGVA